MWINISVNVRLPAASLPFHRVSVHFLLVVQQTVGRARDRDGGVQAQRFSGGQNQLTLQLQLVILNKATGKGSCSSL